MTNFFLLTLRWDRRGEKIGFPLGLICVPFALQKGLPAGSIARQLPTAWQRSTILHNRNNHLRINYKLVLFYC